MSKVMATLGVLGALTFAARAASADDAPAPGPRSRGTAFVLSAGGTGLSVALTVTGLAEGDITLSAAGLLSSLITPSLGEIYAGKPFTWGQGIRVASAGLALAGASESLGCLGQSASTCDRGRGGALIVLGGIGYGMGILYDIATAGSAADDYNRRFHLRVAPIVARTSSSGSTVGAGISGSF